MLARNTFVAEIEKTEKKKLFFKSRKPTPAIVIFFPPPRLNSYHDSNNLKYPAPGDAFEPSPLSSTKCERKPFPAEPTELSPLLSLFWLVRAGAVLLAYLHCPLQSLPEPGVPIFLRRAGRWSTDRSSNYRGGIGCSFLLVTLNPVCGWLFLVQG